MAELKAFKLASGEEIVAEVVEQNDTYTTIKNPLGCVMQRAQDGHPVMGFVPWMQAADSPFDLKNQMIVIEAEVASDVKNGYNQIFGTGIVVPPKQLITG
jgi:hypothetical protein